MTSERFERFADLANQEQLTAAEAAELEEMYIMSEAQTDVREAWERMCDQASARAEAAAMN